MHRVAVLGCGDAGLVATAYLAGNKGIDVTVISENDSHVFSYLLYHVIEGRSLSSASVDLPRTFHDTDITCIRGLVQGLDTDEHRIDLRSGSLGFDSLLISLGGVTQYSIDDRRNVLDIHTDVRTIRRAVRSPAVQHVAIVGGGPVGVETAATLSTLPEALNITLYTAGSRLLPSFPPRARTIVEQELRRREVTLRQKTRVGDVTENMVIPESKSAEQSDLTIWAGGIQPNPVIDSFDLSKTEEGLRVDSYLRCRGTQNIFAAGDIVTYPEKINDGFSAGLEARTAAQNILRQIRGRRLREHHIRLHPRVVYLGGDTALFAMNSIVYCGRIPALLRAIASKSYTSYWKYWY